MEHDLVLEGRVVGPVEVQELEVGVTDGMIAEVRRQGVKGSRRVKAGRCLIFPGFVDAHVHMREPGWEEKEDFRTGSRAALHGGVTTVADMPNNRIPTTTREALLEKRRLSAKSLVDVKLYAGVVGKQPIPEVAGIASGYKAYLARSTGGLIFPAGRLGELYSAAARSGLPVSLHCEDQATIDLMESKLSGVERADLYSDLRPVEAEVESVRTAISGLGEGTSARVNVCHASSEGAVDAVLQARARGLRVSCEAALHHLFFNREAMKRNGLLKTNPPLREEVDREAIVDGLKTGKVSFLVTDHAPHGREEKEELGLAGVPGLDDYGHLVSWLLRDQGVDPVTLCRAAAASPAEFLGLSDRGRVEVGMRGDFAILDPASPEKVKSEDLQTKCGWSPYEGYEFPGRVKWTIRGGEPLLSGYELVS
ncbi:MAG: dihydroorotase family protein [archaeon]|nr:MAG: dihydroorotase family protein [archaeon]